MKAALILALLLGQPQPNPAQVYFDTHYNWTQRACR